MAGRVAEGAGDDPDNVERQLDPRRRGQARATRQFLTAGEVVDEEPQPLEHLRSHVTAPFARGDILSTGAWIGGSEWLGNVLIHALVLFPLLMLVATGARLVAALYRLFNGFSQIDDQVGAVDSRLGVPVLVAGVIGLVFFLLAGVVALWVAFSSIAGALREFRAGHSVSRFGQAEVNQAGGLDRGIVTPLWIASLLFSFSVPPVVTWIRAPREMVVWAQYLGLIFVPDSCRGRSARSHHPELAQLAAARHGSRRCRGVVGIA